MKTNFNYVDLDLREMSCGMLQEFIALQQAKVHSFAEERRNHEDDYIMLCEQRLAEAALYCAKAENASREFLAGVSLMQHEERARQGVPQH